MRSMTKRNFKGLNITLIHQLKRKIEELKYEKKKIEDILENMIDGVTIVGLDGKILFVNQAAALQNGYSKKEAIGKTPLDLFIDKKEAPKFLKAIKTAISGKPTLNEEYIIKTKNGKLIPTRVNLSVLRNTKGKPEAIIAVHRDVTKQKKAEEKLKQSEEKFITIFEKLADGIAIADIKTKQFVDANNKFCDYTGYAKKEILKMKLLDIHPKKDLPHVLNEFKLQSQGKKTLAENIPILRKDKSIVYADVNSISMIIDSKPYLLGVFRDITEQKKTINELKESEKKFWSLLDNSNDIIQSTDINGNFIYVNKKWKKTLGYSDKDIKKLKLTDILRKDQIHHCMKLFKKVISGEKLKNTKTVFITKKGKEIPVIGDASSWFKNKKFIETIGIFREIKNG